MPAVRRCCIIGCDSNSREMPHLQFFQFPQKSSELFEPWKRACHASLSRILPLKKAVICSLHFHPSCIGGRRLLNNALPTQRLNLNSNTKEVSLLEENRKLAYINAVVYEWLVRVNINPNMRGSITHGMMKEQAFLAKQIINLESFNPNNHWLQTFREQHLTDFAIKLAEKRLKPLGTSLEINNIVQDLAHLFDNTSDEQLYMEPEPYGEYEENDENNRSNNQTIDHHTDDDDEQADDCNDVEQVREEGRPRYVLKLKNTGSFNNRRNAAESGYSSSSTTTTTTKTSPLDNMQLQTYEDALQYLKPLEDFVIIKENFRAIGLVSQLETILRRGAAT